MRGKLSFTELVKAIALLFWLGLCLAVLLKWGIGSSGVIWLSGISSALILVIISLWSSTGATPENNPRSYSEVCALMRKLLEVYEEQIESLQKEVERLQKELEEMKFKAIVN